MAYTRPRQIYIVSAGFDVGSAIIPRPPQSLVCLMYFKCDDFTFDFSYLL